MSDVRPFQNGGGQTVSLVIRKSPRAKRLSIYVHADGRVVVSVPRWISKGYAERFVEEKRVWIISSLEHFKRHPIVPRPRISKKAREAHYRTHREAALSLIHARVRHFNAFYQCRVGKITVRNQRSRWGSCSRRGNLSFNYKILFLPEHLRDYIVAHELCHIKEFNHSRAFWQLVSQQFPDHRSLRRELKGYSLHTL